MKATAVKLFVLAGLSISTAQAAEPTGMLTLACAGTRETGRPNAKVLSEQTSMGIIINFTARAVAGSFIDPSVDDYPLAIHSINETTIIFGGADKTGNSSVDGSIDRVTGYVEAVWAEDNARTRYTLRCRPAQRMF
jgi:hypothetical protein